METGNDIEEECGNNLQSQPVRRSTRKVLKASQTNEDKKDSSDSEPEINMLYRLKEVRIKLKRVKLPSGMFS